MLKYMLSKLIVKLQRPSIKTSTIHKTSKVEAQSQVVNSSFSRFSFCGYRCELNCVDVGSFVSIANNVVIGGTSHPMSWVSMSPVFYAGRDSVKMKFSEHGREAIRRTSIGHDVWIGHGAYVKQGINVGIGAVIGMGSVVTKDVRDYEVVAGNPARHIRFRFDDEVRDKLIKSKWWELSEKELLMVAKDVRDPIAFVELIHGLKGKG